jgi:hypothetical protein
MPTDFESAIKHLGGTLVSPPFEEATPEAAMALGGVLIEPGRYTTEKPTVPEFESGQPFFANSEFSRGVARSSARTAGSAVDFLRIFSDSPKLKGIADEFASTAEQIPTKAGNIKDVLNDPTLAPAYIGRVTGELAPQAVMAYLTGGAGAAVGRAAGLGAMGQRVAAGAGAAVTSVPQESGSIFRETGDPEVALKYGVPAGMLDALSAEFIIGKVFRAGTEEAKRKAWREIVHDAFKQVPKAAGFESATETTQETLAILANKSADQTYEMLTPENGWRLLEAAVAGGLGGGLLGGGLEVATLPAQSEARGEEARRLRSLRKLRDERMRSRYDRGASPATADVPNQDLETPIEVPKQYPEGTIFFDSADAQVGQEFEQDGKRYRVSGIKTTDVGGKTTRRATAMPLEAKASVGGKVTNEPKAEPVIDVEDVTIPKNLSLEEFSKAVKVRENLGRGGGDFEVYGMESSALNWGKTPEEAVEIAYRKAIADPSIMAEVLGTSSRATSDVRAQTPEPTPSSAPQVTPQVAPTSPQPPILPDSKMEQVGKNEAQPPVSAPVESAQGGENVAKEPWRQTQAERLDVARKSLRPKEAQDEQWVRDFLGNQKIYHRNDVKRALAEGKPVPAEVLADYPDLQQTTTTKEPNEEAKRQEGLQVAPATGAVASAAAPVDESPDPTHHVAIYNGKRVVVAEKRELGETRKKWSTREFKRAAMRVNDNLPTGGKGIVVAPDGKRYEITNGKRSAKLLPPAQPTQPTPSTQPTVEGEKLDPSRESIEEWKTASGPAATLFGSNTRIFETKSGTYKIHNLAGPYSGKVALNFIPKEGEPKHLGIHKSLASAKKAAENHIGGRESIGVKAPKWAYLDELKPPNDGKTRIAVMLDDGRAIWFPRGASAHIDMVGILPEHILSRVTGGGFVSGGEYSAGGDFEAGKKEGETPQQYYDLPDDYFSGDKTRDSISDKTGGISESDARSTVTRWQKDNPSAPIVEVVNDPAMTRTGSDGIARGVKGLWRNGKLIVNTAFIEDEAELIRTLNHERAHSILSTSEGQKQLRMIVLHEARTEINALRRKYAQREGESDADYEARLVEEYVARANEGDQTVWQRIVAAVRRLLARAGLVRLSDDEVARAIVRAVETNAGLEMESKESIGDLPTNLLDALAAFMGQRNLAALTGGKPLFHETSLNDAKKIYSELRKRPFKQSWTQFLVSDNIDLALGQGGKGVTLEIDPERVNGYVRPKIGTSEQTGREYAIDKSIFNSVRAVIFASNRQLESFKDTFPNSLDYSAAQPFDRGIARGQGIRVPVKQTQKEAAAQSAPTERESIADDVRKDRDDSVTTEVYGEEFSVIDRPRWTPEEEAKSRAIAKAVYDEAGLTVVDDAMFGQDGSRQWQLVDTGKDDAAGRKLIEAARREIKKYGLSYEITALTKSLRLNFATGRMDSMFSRPIRNELFNVAQSPVSFTASLLAAQRGAGEDLVYMGQNVDIVLHRLWHEEYGGDAIDSVLAKIRAKMLAFFTPEVLAEIVRVNPALANIKDAAELIRKGLDSNFANLKELKETYESLLKEYGLGDKEASRLANEIVVALKPRIRVAADEAAKSVESALTPDERDKVKASRKPIWLQIVEAVQRGDFDNSEHVRAKARQEGWRPPTDAEIEHIKATARRINEMRQLTKKEVDAAGGDRNKLKREQVVREQTTLPKQAQLIRNLEASMGSIKRPVNLNPMRWFGKYRANNAAFLNELISANLLVRMSFPVKQAISIFSQFATHIPTRSIAMALERHALAKTQGQQTAFLHDVFDALGGSLKSAIAGYKDGVVQFIAALRGRGEARNVERLTSGIAALERLDAEAQRMAREGKLGAAVVKRLVAFIRLGYRIAQAFDNLHGVPSEYIEMRHQAVLGAMREGRSRLEAETQADNIITSIKASYLSALAETKAMSEALGYNYSSEQLRENAHRIARNWAYVTMAEKGLPGDEFQAANKQLREVLGWNEQEIGKGPGGVVGFAVQKTGKSAEQLGIPLALGRFGNAIATSINRTLHHTPLGFFPKVFGENNAWFETERDRNQRKVEAAIGSLFGGILFTLALSGAFVVRLRWPKDKEERDMMEARGERPGTLMIPIGDGKYHVVSMNTGFAAMFAPYLAAGGALRDLLLEREKAQEKLNAEAARKGVTPEKIRPMSIGDMMAVAGQAGWQTALGGRTSAGVLASMTDYGTPNVEKALASQVGAMIPGLPGLQEVSRMSGVVLDSKLATFTDFLLPLPTSGARRVNMLGDPAGTPDDLQRIVQTLSGGSYPVIDTNAPQTRSAYEVLFASDVRPPSINPNRGYQIGGSYRPFTDSELERYSVERGQEYKAALSALGPDASDRDIRNALTEANNRALGKMGVTTSATRTARSSTRRTRRPMRLRNMRSRGMRSRKLRIRSLLRR